MYSVQKDRAVVLGKKTLGPVYRKVTGVVPGQGGVQREGDGLAALTGDDSGHDVALGKLRLTQILVLGAVGQTVLMQTGRLGGEAAQTYHAVGAVDVQHLHDGAQLMGGVVLAVAVQVLLQTVVALFRSVGDLLAQVVAVTAGAVYHLTQYALTYHVQHHQLPAAVVAVFHKHIGRSGTLVGVHQLPALGHAAGAAHLAGHRDALLHAVEHHLHMGLP